jgi:mannose-6-phosphate isomerase-like protein (cupin superfamily)
MARVGETIVNPVTGEEITWRRVDPDLLEWDDAWMRAGHRTAPHVHPAMEERWQVVEGRAAFRIGDGEERKIGPGEEIVAPPGVPHEGWNPADDPVLLSVTMTPAGRWAEVVELLFGWAAEGRTDETGTPELELLVGLLRGYPDEIAPPPGVTRS